MDHMRRNVLKHRVQIIECERNAVWFGKCARFWFVQVTDGGNFDVIERLEGAYVSARDHTRAKQHSANGTISGDGCHREFEKLAGGKPEFSSVSRGENVRRAEEMIRDASMLDGSGDDLSGTVEQQLMGNALRRRNHQAIGKKVIRLAGPTGAHAKILAPMSRMCSRGVGDRTDPAARGC